MTSESATVHQVLVAFLEWSKNNDSEGNHRYCQQYLAGDRVGAYMPQMLRVRDLTIST